MEVVHSDVFRLLVEQSVLLLSPFFGDFTQLLHVKIESFYQRLVQFALVRSDHFSRLIRDRLEQTQDHLIVWDCSGRVGFWRLRRGTLAQTLHFGREARRAGLRKLRLKCAQTRKEDLVTSDLSL